MLEFMSLLYFYDVLVSILNLETRCSNSAASQSHWFNNRSRHAALLQQFLVKIRSVRILDTIVCLGYCFGCSLLAGTMLNSH